MRAALRARLGMLGGRSATTEYFGYDILPIGVIPNIIGRRKLRDALPSPLVVELPFYLLVIMLVRTNTEIQ